MTASWSSAATGKPQLSYAERLRRAKENSTSSTSQESQPASSNATTRVNGESSYNVKEQSTEPTKAEDQAARSQSKSTTSPSSLNETKGGNGSLEPRPGSNSESVENSTTDGNVESVTLPPPTVNVWEVRKKQQQERSKAIEEQKKGTKFASAVTPQTSQSSNNNVQQIPVQNLRETDVTKSQSRKESASETVSGADWLQKIQMLNGGANMPKLEDVEGSKLKQAEGETKVAVNGSQLPHTSNVQDSSSVSRTSGSTTKSGEAPKSRSSRKKKNKEEAMGEANAKMASIPTLPPSMSDATVWPSPDVAITSVAKVATETEDEAGDRPTTTRRSSISSTSTGLKGLDIELKPGGEKNKKGKQWISIVPTITHTAPLPGIPGKKKNHSKGGGSTSASDTSSPISGTPSSKKIGQRRPSPLPINNRNTGRNAMSSPSVLSPQASEADLMLSPGSASRKLSPKIGNLTLGEGDTKGRSSTSISPNRLAGERLSSPRGLRSPALGGGSVLGPRFTEGYSAERSPRFQKRSSLGGDVTLSQMESTTTKSSEQGNALQLSEANGVISSDPQESTLPLEEQLIPNQDGSFPPVRASATAFLPMAPVYQDSDFSWNSIPMYGSRSSRGNAGPRGTRGRGYNRRTNTGDSSSSKNDNEDRGLPDDVPSGPRSRNGDAMIGGGGLKERKQQSGGNYSRNYANSASDSASGYGSVYVPQGYYYPPPLGPYSVPLESTPAELAPQGDASKSEPSLALLHQIEFYFSHRNLEGDFYLRKNMDSQGFVPIETVANFNKVKKMTDKITVVKETLMFSKVLQVDPERNLVRKAVDWHLYILVDGNRPQQNALQHQQPPPPPFTSPLYPGQQMPYPSQQQMFSVPPPPAYYGQGSFAPYPPAFSTQRPQRLPPHLLQQQQPYGTMNGYMSTSNSQQSRSMRDEVSEGSLGAQSSGKEDDQSGSRLDYDNGDNDDDEEVLGVVAAEGLGGALRV